MTLEAYLAQREKQKAIDALGGAAPWCTVAPPAPGFGLCSRPAGHAGMHVASFSWGGTNRDSDWQSRGAPLWAWEEGDEECLKVGSDDDFR